MSIIPAPPGDINECGALSLLRAKSTELDGVATQVQQFIAVATPMLDLIAAGPFRNYTLHNRDHAKKLLHLADYLIPKETFAQLSLLDCLFLVYSAFLHDMGMAVTEAERSNILKGSDFQDTIRDWSEVSHTISQVRQRLTVVEETEKPALEALLFQLHEAALSAYLRPRHATVRRYKELINHLRKAANNPGLFSFRGVSFEDSLIDVCVSHNLDAAVLNESKSAYDDRFPRDLLIAQESVNTQFCAAVLRLTDIMDFDRERTPRVLFESLGIPSSELPGAEVSLKEWEKHMAVHTIDLRNDEIVISAECHHPAIEKTIREFCALIERELRDTMAILKRNKSSVLAKYSMELPLTVRPRMTSVGYSYMDVSLRLNQSAIISLLMGERLYSHSGVVLRELVQNALDACAVRLESGLGKYLPKIELSATHDELGRTWIEIEDNGTGMDEHVISEYLLKLGDSYYQSSEFTRHFAKLRPDAKPFRPISRFGIGILSTFLIGDVLEVRTKSAFSPRNDFQARVVRIEKLGGLAFIQESHRAEAGTTARVRLKPEIASHFDKFANDAAQYMIWLLLRPAFPLRFALGPGSLTFFLPRPLGSFYSVSSEGKDELGDLGYETIAIELADWSDRLSGTIVLPFALNSARELSHTVDGKRVQFQQDGGRAIDPRILIPNYTGNRITVNGFQVRNFRTRNLMRFASGLRLSFLMDVDAIGGDEIEFDVSRERLTAKGEKFLRDEIKNSVLRAVAETGLLERMTPELRMLLPNIPYAPDEIRSRLANREKPDPLKYMFDAVAAEIPNADWPKGMHQMIGRKLGIQPSLVSKIIAAMIRSGKLKTSTAADRPSESLTNRSP